MARSEKITKKELKEDRFVTLTLELYEFLKNNVKTIMISVGIVIIIIAAFSIYYNNKREKEAAASMAMEKAIKLFEEAEDAWSDQEETSQEESSDAYKDKYEDGKGKFDDIIKRYGSSNYADKALYYSAKASYQIGEYDQAINGFRELVDKYPNSLFALFAQSALGNCYEQKGGEDNLRKAISEYAPQKFEKFATSPQQGHVVAQSLFHQGMLYEKLSQPSDALKSYNQIIDMFNGNLKKAIDDKIDNMLQEAKALVEKITKIPGSLDEDMQANISKAQSYETTGKYEKAFEAYSAAIHLYKSQKGSGTAISPKLEAEIREYDERAEDFSKNLRDARRYESQEQQSSALYAYDRAVGLNFAPTRELYENTLLQRDRIQISQVSSTDNQKF
ncbi:TPA: tetratricopeptide repeat protein [Candidatus Poribacteria bacterium]|nr:tetratricopeptide repeat protein [Candidatus Poribacteria bacterium]